MDDNIYKKKYIKYKIKYNNLKKAYENIGTKYDFNKWTEGTYFIICKLDKFINIINECDLYNGDNRFEMIDKNDINNIFNENNTIFNYSSEFYEKDFIKFIYNLIECNRLEKNEKFMRKFNIKFNIKLFDEKMNQDFYYFKKPSKNTTSTNNYIIKNNSIVKNNSVLYKLSNISQVCTINSIIPNFEIPIKIKFDYNQFINYFNNEFINNKNLKDNKERYYNNKELVILLFLILNVYTNQEFGIKFRYVKNLIEKLNKTFENYIITKPNNNFDYNYIHLNNKDNNKNFSKIWIALRVNVKQNYTSNIDLVYTINESTIINTISTDPMKEIYGIEEYINDFNKQKMK